MRKVTKILLMLLSTTILLLIILPLALSLLISLSSVQSFLVERFAQVATTKIDSKVAIGGVQFTPPNSITLNDVLIEDSLGDTMIFAKSVSSRISALSLLHGELVMGRTSLEDGQLRLREVKSGLMNITETIDKAFDSGEDSSFKTVFTQIDVVNLDFSLHLDNDITFAGYGIDYNNITIDDISGSVSDVTIHDHITSLTIESFSGRERSGFIFNNMKAKFVTYEGVVDFTNLDIVTPYSHLYMPKLRLEGFSWDDYKDFNNNVSLDLLSQYSTLSTRDGAYFAPELRNFNFTANSLLCSINGTVNNMQLQIDNMNFAEQSSLKGEVSMRDVTDFLNSEFDLHIDKLTTSQEDIDETIIDFGGEALPENIAQMVATLGRIELTAKGAGTPQDFSLETRLDSSQGAAEYRGELRKVFTSPQIEGVISTQDLNLGGLLANSSLGQIAMNSSVAYNTKEKGFDSKVAGTISQVRYKSCNYSGIDFNAFFNGELLDADIISRDAALDFDMTGVIRLGDKQHYDITTRVKNIDLKALELNHRDSISRLSGSLRVNLGGRDIDNLNGSVVLRNINYVYNQKSLYVPMVDISARNSEQSKYLALKSDYVDASFNSKSSYESLYNYLKDGIREYIPLLYSTATERKGDKKMSIANNYSTLLVDFKNFSGVSDAIFTGFKIADNSSFNMMVNPYSERFSLRLQSDFIEHNNIAALALNVNASNDKDSLALYATASDLMIGNRTLSSPSLMAGARNNRVQVSTGFRDSLANISATLGMRALFDGVQRANIEILPSQISMGDDMWMISARDIVGDRSSLTIDDFAMVNGSQHLMLNGVISKSPEDELVLTLNNYDISMLTGVVSNFGYSIQGASNGYVNICELLGEPRIVADVKLDNVNVNSIPAPPLHLSADWDAQQSRASLFVSNRHKRDTIVKGYYSPSDVRYYAHLRTDRVNMGLLDPLLSSTIEGTKGLADIDVTLQGQGNDASLNGTIDVSELSTKILYTQVEYSVPQARIEVKDNKLSTFARTMYDRDGNHGLLTMNLSLDQLSNVTYSFRIVPENMLVLNTTLSDNDLFYGKLYASGVATISGDRRSVNMDITATSKPNSSFFMPLSTKSSVAKTDFITFLQPEKRVSVQDEAINSRRRYINERNARMSAQDAIQMNINMALQATPDLDFQLVIDPVVGDIIKAKGEGRLNLNIAPSDNIFEMYGDYNITEGNYLFSLLNPISKRFMIDSGSSIQWTGDPLDPLLDIDAVYKIKTSLDPLMGGATEGYTSRAVPVDCIIELGDRLAQPSVNFSIEVPTADTEQQAVIANTLIDQETISQQFFYLMFANSFIPVTNSYGSGLGGSTTAATGFELLTNQLSNWLSSSNYNVVIRYRPESDLTSDEVDVGFSRGLIDNRLLIEVEGNYQADNKAAALDDSGEFSNFMGEAYVTWLIDRAGALRLKGFTQTIDRYDENQGLQETGIGIYYSESFNDFKDLKRRIRERFRFKKREENE